MFIGAADVVTLARLLDGGNDASRKPLACKAVTGGVGRREAGLIRDEEDEACCCCCCSVLGELGLGAIDDVED